jgi:hypothetical protein
MSQPTAPKTPAVAIARVLRGLGLTQGHGGKDFSVAGYYRNGERQYTYVVIYSRHAEEVIAAHADEIEDAANKAGFHFNVSIAYSTAGKVYATVQNAGHRIRETAPATTTGAEAPEPKEEPMTSTPEPTPVGAHFVDGQYGTRFLFVGDEYIGTTSNSTEGQRTAFSVRTHYLKGKFADDQAAAETMLAAHKPAPHEAGEVHHETYRGVEFTVTFKPGGSDVTKEGRRHGWADQYQLTYNGRVVSCPVGDVKTIAKKVRGWIDTEHADKTLLPTLLGLVDARQSVEGMPGWDDGATPKVGDTAYVYAQGRYRRGLVTKVARARATVSYTTASSQGRIYHKADKHDELAAG